MSKTVNKQQINILFDEMIENPDIARGFIRENKTKASDFWENIKYKLNCVVPSVKTTAEWKKVWLDQKIYLRKRATTNMQYRNGTGGGPNKEYKFSPSEEIVLEILGTKEAADGVEGSRSFGLKTTKLVNETQGLLTSDGNVESRSKQTNLVTNDVTIEPTIKQANSGRKRKVEMTTAEIAMIGLETQKKLCDEMTQFKSKAESHYRDEESSLKRIYRALDKILEQKKLGNEEVKRHHLEMEAMRKMELELKKSEVESSLKMNALMMETENVKLQKLRNDKDK